MSSADELWNNAMRGKESPKPQVKQGLMSKLKAGAPKFTQAVNKAGKAGFHAAGHTTNRLQR